MDPQEIAKNIENISKKYNIDIDNVFETIGEENDNWYDENIIIRVPDEEKILLIGFAGKITINDTINLIYMNKGLLSTPGYPEIQL